MVPRPDGPFDKLTCTPFLLLVGGKQMSEQTQIHINTNVAVYVLDPDNKCGHCYLDGAYWDTYLLVHSIF